jgi:hypothetical protein
MLVLALVSVTVTPPVGAATGSVTGNAAEELSPTITPDGSPMGPAVTTVTFAVVSEMKGDRLAWITAEPKLTAVTSTLAVVAPAAKVTVAGTVATAVLAELRLTVSPPAGAAADNVSVIFFVLNPVMVAVAGVNVTVAFTWAPPVPFV